MSESPMEASASIRPKFRPLMLRAISWSTKLVTCRSPLPRKKLTDFSLVKPNSASIVLAPLATITPSGSVFSSSVTSYFFFCGTPMDHWPFSSVFASALYPLPVIVMATPSSGLSLYLTFPLNT